MNWHDQVGQGTMADMHDNWVDLQENHARSRLTYAIFRQDRFVGWSAGETAIDALDLWIDASSENETDGTLSRRVLPGPWSAVEKQEAIDRRML